MTFYDVNRIICDQEGKIELQIANEVHLRCDDSNLRKSSIRPQADFWFTAFIHEPAR